RRCISFHLRFSSKQLHCFSQLLEGTHEASSTIPTAEPKACWPSPPWLGSASAHREWAAVRRLAEDFRLAGGFVPSDRQAFRSSSFAYMFCPRTSATVNLDSHSAR